MGEWSGEKGAGQCDFEHRDGCMTEYTWDEDDCTCRAEPTTFDTHVEALDAAIEARLDGDASDG